MSSLHFIGIIYLFRYSSESIYEFVSYIPWWISGKESACDAGGMGLIPTQEDLLEKEMATHSSILAWEIPWTGKLGGL